MVCTHCGANVPEGTKFCPFCGAALNVQPANKAVQDDRYRPLSPWEYWGLTLLYAVPLIGFIFMIVFSFSDANIHRRNFTRSFWCSLLLVLVLVIILIATGAAGALAYELF